MPEPMETPSLAEQFWQHAPGPETEELQEPLRSVMVVKNFLAALEHLDFGTAKDSPVLISMLRRAEVEGDPSYASPEQLRGENLDTRAVIFSLGVVLFERLTGRHPFGAENNRPRRLDRIRRGEMGSGVNSFPTIPAGLRAVLVRAMSPFAEERFTDLRELRNALRNTAGETRAPKLPGASEAPNTDREVTKVVRMPTEFGQELMNVVAEHDGKPAEARPAPRRTGRQSAQPETVPATARPAPSPTPSSMPAPPMPAPPMPAPSPKSSPVLAPSFPAPLRHATPELVARAISEPRMRRPPRIGLIAVTAGLVGAAVALGVVFALGTKDPAPAPSVAPIAAVTPQPAPAPTPIPPPAPAPAPTVAPTPTSTPTPSPVPAPVPAPVLAPAPPPIEIAPAPAPTPTPTPPASGSVEEHLAAAVTPCLEDRPTRVFGLSLALSKGTVVKAYFGSDDPISHAERTCISAAIKGITGDGAPTSGDLMYKVRGGAAGVTLTPHGPRH